MTKWRSKELKQNLFGAECYWGNQIKGAWDGEGLGTNIRMTIKAQEIWDGNPEENTSVPRSNYKIKRELRTKTYLGSVDR